ncbi:hypothetical protein B7H23_12155 [Notoacmeibacter marinus]|uniref:Uncharacterized protein n=1 Tax=Notoacmeibacter marinus TaxID=1876515 RepID=A0A231UY56_9HYPH|nr:hypothetical protein B7H23_12155 [Notoacmeibacter marinus]
MGHRLRYRHGKDDSDVSVSGQALFIEFYAKTGCLHSAKTRDAQPAWRSPRATQSSEGSVPVSEMTNLGR